MPFDPLPSPSIPNGPPEAVPGSRGDPWVDWIEQHWFLHDSDHPFRRTKDSRALRGDLEEVLQEFWRGNPDGPVARRLIAAAIGKTARDREVWNARIARRNQLAASRDKIEGGAP